MICHDCFAKPGEYHQPGCDVERCPRCGGQAITCTCIYEINGIDPVHMEETHPHIWEHGANQAMLTKWDLLFADKRVRWGDETW